jgi:ABC-type multidrug transport system ATPase subunit
VADEVAIISRGKRVLQAPVRELLSGSSTVLAVEVEGDPRRLLAEIRRLPYVRETESSRTDGTPLHRIRLEVSDLPAARRDVPVLVVAQDLLFVSCRPEQRSLEEVFLDLTGGNSGDIKQ